MSVTSQPCCASQIACRPASREVERASAVRKQRQNVFGKRPQQEGIRDHPRAGRFPIFLVPAIAFVVRKRKRHGLRF